MLAGPPQPKRPAIGVAGALIIAALLGVPLNDQTFHILIAGSPGPRAMIGVDPCLRAS